MMDVDDADNISAAHQGNREKGIVGVLDQGGEPFEARSAAGIRGKRDTDLCSATQPVTPSPI